MPSTPMHSGPKKVTGMLLMQKLQKYINERAEAKKPKPPEYVYWKDERFLVTARLPNDMVRIRVSWMGQRYAYRDVPESEVCDQPMRINTFCAAAPNSGSPTRRIIAAP